MRFYNDKKTGYTLIGLGICALLHVRLLAIALIVIGLTYIDINVFETVIHWFKKTFSKDYDPNEGWIDWNKNEPPKKPKKKKD